MQLSRPSSRNAVSHQCLVLLGSSLCSGDVVSVDGGHIIAPYTFAVLPPHGNPWGKGLFSRNGGICGCSGVPSGETVVISTYLIANYRR